MTAKAFTMNRQWLGLRLFALAIIAGAAMLAACGSAASQPSQLIKIKVANPSVAAPGAILQVTKDAGLFEKNGLDVDLQVINGAPELLAALLSGDISIAMQGSPAILQAQISGANIVMFAGAVNTTFFSIFSRPEIKTVPDLKGKKVGSTPGGGNDQSTVNLVLARYGLKPTDVQVINLPQQNRIQALQNGAVDAIAITEPYTYAARKLGINELIDVSALNLAYQSSAFVTTKPYLRDHRDVVVRFLRSLTEGIKFYKTNREASENSLAAFTKLDDPGALDETWQAFALKFTSKVPDLSIPGLQYVIDNSIDDPKAKGRKAEEFIDRSLIQQLDDEGFFRSLYGDNTGGV